MVTLDRCVICMGRAGDACTHLRHLQTVGISLLFRMRCVNDGDYLPSG